MLKHKYWCLKSKWTLTPECRLFPRLWDAEISMMFHQIWFAISVLPTWYHLVITVVNSAVSVYGHVGAPGTSWWMVLQDCHSKPKSRKIATWASRHCWQGDVWDCHSGDSRLMVMILRNGSSVLIYSYFCKSSCWMARGPDAFLKTQRLHLWTDIKISHSVNRQSFWGLWQQQWLLGRKVLSGLLLSLYLFWEDASHLFNSVIPFTDRWCWSGLSEVSALTVCLWHLHLRLTAGSG